MAERCTPTDENYDKELKKMIRYPKPLQIGDTIGICAPSTGVEGAFACKLDNAKKQLKELGYHTVETPSVRNRKKLTSNTPEIRASEFENLYLNEHIHAIIPPWGGEFLMDMLPHLNFSELAAAPAKWIMGFSDISTLLFTLTLKLTIATVHGPNFLDFGNVPVDPSVLNALNILNNAEGATFIQQNLEHYQKEWLKVTETNFPPYNLTERVHWKILGETEAAEFSGRLIGGNMDVLCKLIGTPFAPVKEYVGRYAEEGVIWYFESCEMNATDVYRTLWQMKMNGWFENCRGFLFGRPEGLQKVEHFGLTEALTAGLSDLDVPIVYDIDLGHVPPQLTFINGCIASCKVKANEGVISQTLTE
jgi:muramoyltetrapeptide carboxypeptidase LdcA involved in peptidoglycan recycling